MTNQRQETIAAVATPHGNAALGIVRLSGPDAFRVAESVFSGPGTVSSFPSHTVHYGKITRGPELVDRVMLSKMDSPHTFTGEDAVEITCHGGRLVVHNVLAAVIEAGARPANPGEFSLRAFLNGKMDLAQAEAVQELISAESELSVRAASQQLEGRLSETILSARDSVADLLVLTEALIDFPEDDLEPEEPGGMSGRVGEVRRGIVELAETYADGRRIQEGVKVVIAGKPNVGKSSLLNSLLEKDRAIITHLPGTTRDTLQDSLIWQGVALQVTDTAGIRKPGDVVEEEGVRRSMEAIEKADLVLFVVDASEPLSQEDREVGTRMPGRRGILVLNKTDLPKRMDNAAELAGGSMPTIEVSALRNANIDKLKDLIVSEVWKNGVPDVDGAIITSARHKKALDDAANALTQVQEAIAKGLSNEFVALHLREALESLGAIVGSVTTEDVLNGIFSRFCIGK